MDSTIATLGAAVGAVVFCIGVLRWVASFPGPSPYRFSRLQRHRKHSLRGAGDGVWRYSRSERRWIEVPLTEDEVEAFNADPVAFSEREIDAEGDFDVLRLEQDTGLRSIDVVATLVFFLWAYVCFTAPDLGAVHSL